MLTALGAFLAVSAVVICTPGQDTALTIRNTLAGGRHGGIATAGGVALGQAIWTIAAAVGVVALLSASEPAFRALKLAGATYLVYLGATSLWSAFAGRGEAHTGRAAAEGPARRLRPVHGFRQGVVSNLGNPKMAIFFASLLPQFAPEGRGAFLVVLALGFVFCSMTLAWLTVYAVAVHRLRAALAGSARRALDALAGIVLVLFGIRIALAER